MSEQPHEMKYCRDCGKEIRAKAEICPHCGIRQTDTTSDPETHKSNLTSQYSALAWIASVFFAIITFPFGLIIPIYFFIKANNGTGIEQGTWETWTVIFFGILGIIAVEIGGEKGAKFLWLLLAGLIVFIIFSAILAAFVFGLGSSASGVVVGGVQ